MEHNRLGDIVAFIATVKQGSFTAAAETLGLTRSAVGKSVTRLETQLGVRLLHRTTRTLSLSDEGRVAFERWQQILDDLEEVDATMAARRGQPTGTLQLTAPLSFGQRHILPVLGTFMTQWPELKADVHFTDRFVDLIEEGFDLAIRIGEPTDDSQLLTRTVAEQEFVTCASPGYLAEHGTPDTPQALSGHDTIALLRRGQPGVWHYQTSYGPYQHNPLGRMRIDSSEALREAALAGFGLIQSPTYIVGRDLSEGTLVEVLGAFRPPTDPIRVTYPSKRHLSPRVRAFIDLLTEQWKNGVPWENVYSSV